MGYLKTNKAKQRKAEKMMAGPQAAWEGDRREDRVEAETSQEATVAVWMRPDGGLGRSRGRILREQPTSLSGHSDRHKHPGGENQAALQDQRLCGSQIS